MHLVQIKIRNIGFFLHEENILNMKKYFFVFNFIYYFRKKSVGSEIRTLVTTATTLDPDH